MNVLYVLHTDGLAGANRSFLQLIKGIKDSDESVTMYVVVPLDHGIIAPILEELGCVILPEDFTNCTTVMHGVRESIRYLIKSRGYRSICDDVKKLNVDIIHTNTSVCDLGAYLAHELKVPHIWHVRENMAYYRMSVIRPFLYKRMIESTSNTVVCISHYIEGYIRKRYKKIRSAVVYDPIEITEITGNHAKKPTNLFISGIIVKNKGIEDAINALNIVVNKQGIDSIRLIIAGTSEDTAVYENELKEIVTQYNLNDHVEFLPFVENIDEIRSGCDIALQCSVMEGLGRVTIEAMLNKLLVIGARSGATEELIRDGYNGWLYEPGDSVGLADRIKTVIELDDIIKNEIKQNAYKWAKETFGISKVSEQILNIYKDALNEGSN